MNKVMILTAAFLVLMSNAMNAAPKQSLPKVGVQGKGFVQPQFNHSKPMGVFKQHSNYKPHSIYPSTNHRPYYGNTIIVNPVNPYFVNPYFPTNNWFAPLYYSNYYYPYHHKHHHSWFGGW